MEIKALIFDMDGVIMDSMGMWDTLVIDYLSEKGIDADEAFSRSLYTCSMGQAAKKMTEKFNMGMTPEEIVEDVNDYISDFYFNKVQPKTGAAEGLFELAKSGIRICLATSTDRPLAEAALKRTGIFDCFEFILTSSEIGKGKDEPDIFLKASEMFGIEPSKLLVIEDNAFAVKTAAAAGFKTCGVYDEHEKDIFPLLKESADFTIEKIGEIKEHI